MQPFEYRRARDSGEALALIADAAAESRLLAGGTDLLPLMKDRVIHPGRLVDIKRLPDLNGAIRVSEHGVSIGALATLADLTDHAGLAAAAPLLVDAARSAATPQIRRMATVGGNLLQRPRCWYFRHPRFHCWLAGGDGCPARDGRNDRHAIFAAQPASPCCAVHPSDLAPCLVALDADVVLRARTGDERLLPVAELFRPPVPERRTETVQGGELLTEVRWARLPAGTRTVYLKASSRRTWSFALAAVAARLAVTDGRIGDARVVLGGVANVPWRSRRAEQVLRGAEPGEAVFERAAAEALADAEPLHHNAYKVPLARGLLVRALTLLARRAPAQ